MLIGKETKAKQMITKAQISALTMPLCHFIGHDQQIALIKGLKGEDSQYFIEKLTEYAKRIQNMPKTYEQENKGNKAIVSLHYFTGNCDWWILEKDVDTDGEGQIQAFGFANLGYGSELGYISISELIQNNCELDLHFTPITVEELKNTWK